MGSKPFFAFLPLIRPLLRISGIAMTLGILAGCISDGPNRTGGQYLENQDIRLQNPLYHVILPHFPVDSVWTVDPQVLRASDSVLMLGRSGDFEGQVRMAFDIADTNYLDSLRKDSSAFRLSVGPFISSGAGMVDLINSVGDSAAKISEMYRDSLSIRVQSWVFSDFDSDKNSSLTKKQREDTLKRYNTRFMVNQDPLSLLTQVSAIDTIKLQVKGAYIKDNLQAKNLPHLQTFLTQLPGSPKLLVHLHLAAIPDSNTKAMGLLRLDNRVNASRPSGSNHGPALLFGSPNTTALTATAKQRLTTILRDEAYSANSQLLYSGPKTDIIPARGRRLHFVLNREKLRDSIQVFLKKSGINPPDSAISGNFDITYFVPFAKISLPVDTTRFRGQFPMLFSLRSDLDSILPEPPNSLVRTQSFALNKPAVLTKIYSRSEPNKVVDTVSILFQRPKRLSSDSNYLEVVLRHNSDSTRNDSTFILLGESQAKVVGYTTGYSSLNLTLTTKTKSGRIDDAELIVSYYLSTPGSYEKNALRDPETGKLLTEISDKVSQANQSSGTDIEMRVTHGLQMLLNRADAGKNVMPEFVLQTGQSIDTAANIGDKSSVEYIPYPVLNIIPPKFMDSKLSVGLDFYLYPLKQEP